MVQIYNNLFSIFDLIMKHNKHSPSNYQNIIRGGLLKQNDIKLGLQNKCLNDSYLFDLKINKQLIVIGENIFERSKKIDKLIDKILNLSQYASPDEVILLEQIRQEITKYDYNEKIIQQNAISILNNQKHYPSVPVLYYRENNFYDLYKLYIKLEIIVLNENKYFERNIFINKIQHLFYSKAYTQCKYYINDNKQSFLNDKNLYQGYYMLCEYYLGNKKKSYILLEDLYKNRPYSGSLVSSRGILKNISHDNKAMEILANYYSNDEINALKVIITQENKQHNNFVENNKGLLKYFSLKDTRLKTL
jgi:hypothetical protein